MKQNMKQKKIIVSHDNVHIKHTTFYHIIFLYILHNYIFTYLYTKIWLYFV